MNRNPNPSAAHSRTALSTIQNKLAVQRGVAITFALLVWHIASKLLDQSLLLVSPIHVAARLLTIWLDEGFWQSLGFSFTRIVLGFLSGFALGLVFAVIAGRFKIVEVFLWPFVTTIKSVPVASFVIISLIWLGASELSIFISFLMVFPIIYSNILQGLKSTDPKLVQMADLYRLPMLRRLRYIYAPQIKPFLLSGCSVALGLSWKSGIAAEIIGIPDGSIGEKLYLSKIYFDTTDLFAWTVIIVVISIMFEKLFLYLLKRIFAVSESARWTSM